MNEESWTQLNRLLDEALDLPPGIASVGWRFLDPSMRR